MKGKVKLSIIFVLTALLVIALPFIWVFVDAHLYAKILWTLLIVFDLIIFASSYSRFRGEKDVKLFSQQGLFITLIGLFVFSLILLLIIILRS